LWRVELGYGEMIEIARRLGSDVPFFLLGGTALGVGRGEEVYPLEEARSDHLLLVNCGIGVSTASAYARLSRLTRPNDVRIMPFTLLAARDIHELPLAARNDLQEVVAAAHPEIAEVIKRLKSLGASHALMSGSGATVFGVFDNLETSEKAQDEMRASGFWSERVRAIGRREYDDTIFDRFD
jgi:4-diphosphocytidyl-2-C-methyl-D-erythritol kinase